MLYCVISTVNMLGKEVSSDKQSFVSKKIIIAAIIAAIIVVIFLTTNILPNLRGSLLLSDAGSEDVVSFHIVETDDSPQGALTAEADAQNVVVGKWKIFTDSKDRELTITHIGFDLAYDNNNPPDLSGTQYRASILTTSQIGEKVPVISTDLADVHFDGQCESVVLDRPLVVSAKETIITELTISNINSAGIELHPVVCAQGTTSFAIQSDELAVIGPDDSGVPESQRNNVSLSTFVDPPEDFEEFDSPLEISQEDLQDVEITTNTPPDEITTSTLNPDSEIVVPEPKAARIAVTCPLTVGHAYKSPLSSAVWYVATNPSAPNPHICYKRAFRQSEVFFTYFSDWDSVERANNQKLGAIPEDPLGFMPLGPRYTPQYGALVKQPFDSKVYLILGTEKYWITSEEVFNALGYEWSWVEDVHPDFLNNYTTGFEITFTDHHPSYTLIKYRNSAHVYRLEPDPRSPEKQVKRLIPNEAVFKRLNFRFDRIVTVRSGETYPDGPDLR